MCLHYKNDQKSTGKWLENWNGLFRNLKNTVLDTNHSKMNKNTAKPHILTQLDEIFRLVRDLTIFEEKKFWSIFVVRVPPLDKKSQKNFFFKYSQITYQ